MDKKKGGEEEVGDEDDSGKGRGEEGMGKSRLKRLSITLFHKIC